MLFRSEKTGRSFLKGWDNLNVDECMEQCSDDMCYLNQPLEAIRGKDDVRKMIASIFEPAKRCEFVLINVFGKGNRVITERLDQWDWDGSNTWRSEEHTSELQSRSDLVCRLLLEKNTNSYQHRTTNCGHHPA